MSEALLANEPFLRLGIFLATLLLLVMSESFAPRRQLTLNRWQRWPGNVGIAVVNTLVLRLLFPAAAVGFAVFAGDRGWGVFNQVHVSAWLAVPITIVLLDLVIYWQHVIFHRVPSLWRLHRMHHADLDIDVTTGARFHPLEILLSMLIKFAAILLLGAPAIAVLLFEILLNAVTMFNHANLRLPIPLDRMLRWFVVTPDMHRVHHSVESRETNSNFGFNLPWWDRLFGSYRDQPEAGHRGMTIGLREFREPGESRLDRLLLQPWRKDPSAKSPSA